MATQISFQDINTRVGQASNYSSSMSWIKSITKAGQESNSLGDYNNKYWYKRDVDGNCNNGNCTTGPASTGNKNCVDCYLTNLTSTQYTINCDTKNYLQTNCNCACTYNCNKNQYATNCDCDCNCDCWICNCLCDCW